MLKRDITYENYDGDTVTESFYFNITKTEWLRFQARFGGDVQDFVKKITATQDMTTLMQEFESLVLATYGVREGNKFDKSASVVEDFKANAAYHQLIWELATDAEKAAEFIKAVLPKDLEQEAERMEANAKKLEQAAGEKTLPTQQNVFESTKPELTLPPQPPQR